MTANRTKLQGSTPRTRIDDNVDYPGRKYWETTFGGTTTEYVTAHRSCNVGVYNVTSDVVTHGYHRRIAAGEVINHGYYNRKIMYSSGYRGFEYLRNSGSGSTVRRAWSDHWYTVPIEAPVSVPVGAPISSLMREAGTQALGRMNAADVEGLVELAEAHKVRDTFKFNLNGLNEHLERQLKRTTPLTRSAIQALGGLNRVAASNWLRYRYGIMPILYLLEDVAVGEKVRLTRETARGYASWSNEWTQTETKSGNYYTDVHTLNGVHECYVRAGVLYRPDPHFNRWGVSLREIPAAAVELTPYSFVADWFVNITPFVRSAVMPIGVKQLARWTTVKHVVSSSVSTQSTWRNVSGFTNVYSTSGGYNVTVEETNRVPYIRSGLVLRRQSIKEIPADKRLVDLWALTTGNFQRLMTSQPRLPSRR